MSETWTTDENRNKLIFEIRENWDYSPHLFEDPSSNFHVNRSDKASILDFFLRRKEGALLISGKRGVGKTSIILSTLNEARRLLEHETILLPVLINAANFEIWKNKDNSGTGVDASGDNSSSQATQIDELDLWKLKRSFLENLARRMFQLTCKYEVSKDWKVSRIHENELTENPNAQTINTQVRDSVEDQYENKDSLAVVAGIAKLFRRAVAKEATSTMKNEASDTIQQIKEKEFTAKLGSNERLLVVISSLISSIIIGTHPIISNQVWNTVLSVLITVLPILSISIAAQVYSKSSSRKDDAQVASTYYRYDYDLSNLESELESTLKTLQRMKCKVIFIIDEVDKIQSKEIVSSVIKLLKTLFNHGYAIYVIVTGREQFKEIMKDPQKRLTEYTLFSQTLFLQRAQFEELRIYIERIMLINAKLTKQNAVRSVFSLDNDFDGKTIGYFTENKYPIEDNLQKIENAKITRKNEEVIITYQKNENAKEYQVSLSRNIVGSRALIFPDEKNKNIICEFVVLEVISNNKSLYTVYSKSRDFSDFQYYVCYLSRTDFFDLYKVIRDYINYGEELPKLTIEAKINDTIRTYANLQRALEAIFIRKRFQNQSDWFKNDILLDNIYSFLTDVTERHLNLRYLEFKKDPFEIKYLSRIQDRNNPDVTSGKKFDFDTNLDENIKDIVKDTLNDLIKYLLRLEFLKSTSEEDIFEVTGSLLYIDPSIKTFVEGERDFVNKYSQLCYILQAYIHGDDLFGKK